MKSDNKQPETTKSKIAAKPALETKREIITEPLTNGDSKPEVKVDTPANLTPQLVKRVHELHEQLGREEVQAVEDLEKAAKSKTEKHK